MTKPTSIEPAGAEGGATARQATPPPVEEGRRHKSLGEFLSPKNIGAIYVWIAIVIVFALIAPDTFPTMKTAKSILNQYSVTGLMALSLMLPLAASYYDLSIGYTMTLSGVVVAELLNTTSWSPVLCALVAMACALSIGLINAFVVVGLGVSSFIGTLGTGAIAASATIAISHNLTITGRIGESFSNLATTDVGGITLPVFYLLALMIVLGYLLERTGVGRRIYAIGFDRETARRTGIAVNRLGILALLSSATIAGFAGLVLAARVSAGSPEAGPSYLLPSFSAAFLGATQLRGGRINPWGAVIAVLLIGTGDTGLLLSGGPIWTPQLFESLALITAVALTGIGQNVIRERIEILRANLRSRHREEAEEHGT